jgi:CheY-like chemotaxis protein
MSFTHAVAPELPYLRRYSRAITGSQALGDAAVRETLEAILAAPEEFNAEGPARLELYRVFHRIWQPGALGDLNGNDNLPNMSQRARQALLLTAVEGFSLKQTAEILMTSADELSADLQDAKTVMADSLKSQVMIIEDEAIIALHIQSIVKSVGHDVVGVARTHAEAVKMARETQPELVLADISLADGSSGIDAVKEILEDIDVPVIFVTAFPERLLTGERPEPTYLITKPFEPIMLTATIAQALLSDRENKAAVSQAA